MISGLLNRLEDQLPLLNGSQDSENAMDEEGAVALQNESTGPEVNDLVEYQVSSLCPKNKEYLILKSEDGSHQAYLHVEHLSDFPSQN